MVLVTILEKKEYGEFVIQDDKKQKYSFIFEFYGLEQPQVGDALYLDEKYLNRNWEGFAQPYAFSAEERDLNFKAPNETREDFGAVHYKDGRKVLVKRIYG